MRCGWGRRLSLTKRTSIDLTSEDIAMIAEEIVKSSVNIGLKSAKAPRIRAVRAFVIAPSEMGADYHNQHGSHWIIDLPIANPMSVYEEYKAKRTSWGINALGTVLVEVELNDGT